MKFNFPSSKKKLQDDIFCLKEERNFFESKYLEQVSEIAELKKRLDISKRENSKLTAIFLGFGNVGQRCAELMMKDVGPSMKVIGVSDSRGGIFLEEGIDLEKLLRHKRESGSVKDFSAIRAVSVESSQELYNISKIHGLSVVIDVSPVNLSNGGPALPILQDALTNGINCVLANKAPLVLDYENLTNLSQRSRSSLLYSATVCGGLPVINVGCRDLRGAKFRSISGIFNSTSNFVLTEMGKGKTMQESIKEAQIIGIAEADPSLDIEGYDTANKLVIIINAVVGHACTLKDVYIQGIQDITIDEIDDARAKGEIIRLVANFSVVNPDNDSTAVMLSVQPTRVPIDSFFGKCVDASMCIRFETDIFDTIELKTDERSVYPTSAAVLRDCFDLCKADS